MDMPVGAFVALILLSVLLMVLLCYVVCIQNNSTKLDLFVVGIGLLCASVVFYSQLHWDILLCIAASLAVLSGYSIWFYMYNMNTIRRAYLDGKKIEGVVTSRLLIHGRSYYEVECKNCLVKVRTKEFKRGIGDTVTIWRYNMFMFADGSNIILSGDGFVLLGCRVVVFLVWLVFGIFVSWFGFVVAAVMVIWQLWASDLQFVLKRGTEHSGVISGVTRIGGKLYLDLDTGKRVKPFWAVDELFPVGATISCVGSFADANSIIL